MSFIGTLRSLTRIRGHALSTIGLGPESIVVDAGAHRGEFSRALVERFGCRCYLVEANPEWAGALGGEDCFAGVAAAALGAKDGRASFYLRDNLESSSLCSKRPASGVVADTEVISLATLQERFGLPRIDVLKMDVEGAEFDVLRDAPADLLIGIDQISVEFHDFMPVFARQGLYEAVRHRLRSLGFLCCCATFRTHGDVLFLNHRRFALGRAAATGIAALAKWQLRIKR